VGINAALQGDWEVRQDIALSEEQRKHVNGWRQQLKNEIRGKAKPSGRFKGLEEDLKAVAEAKKNKGQAPKAAEEETVEEKEERMLDELDLVRKHELRLHLEILTPAQRQRWLTLIGERIKYRLPKRFPVYDVLTPKEREKAVAQAK
jgi:hypothetical protein